VVKNLLAARAAQGTRLESIRGQLPMALIWGGEESRSLWPKEVVTFEDNNFDKFGQGRCDDVIHSRPPVKRQQVA